MAGFNKWKDTFHRTVKKGEKGIKILAPAPYKVKQKMEKLDEQGKPILDKDGKPLTEEKTVQIPAFQGGVRVRCQPDRGRTAALYCSE